MRALIYSFAKLYGGGAVFFNGLTLYLTYCWAISKRVINIASATVWIFAKEGGSFLIICPDEGFLSCLRTKRPKSLWSNYPLFSFYAHCTPHFRKKTPKHKTDLEKDSQSSWQINVHCKVNPPPAECFTQIFFSKVGVSNTFFAKSYLLPYCHISSPTKPHTPQGTSSNNSKLQCIIDIEQWTYFHTICSVTIMINIAIAVVQIRQLIYWI